jgi:hypothetical protein
VDFLYSLHHMALYQRQECIRDFAAALEAVPLRRRNQAIPRDLVVVDFLDYFRAARFSEQVARYLDVFGEAQVKILLLDDLRADSAALYRDLLEFLAIDTAFQPDLGVVNACRRLRSPLLRGVSKRLQGATVRYFGQGAADLPERLENRLDSWTVLSLSLSLS